MGIDVKCPFEIENILVFCLYHSKLVYVPSFPLQTSVNNNIGVTFLKKQSFSWEHIPDNEFSYEPNESGITRLIITCTHGNLIKIKELADNHLHLHNIPNQMIDMDNNQQG